MKEYFDSSIEQDFQQMLKDIENGEDGNLPLDDILSKIMETPIPVIEGMQEKEGTKSETHIDIPELITWIGMTALYCVAMYFFFWPCLLIAPLYLKYTSMALPEIF
jgi:hypothetical protein